MCQEISQLTADRVAEDSTRRDHERHVLCGAVRNVYITVGVVRALADSSDFGLLGEQSSQKMCDSLPWTPMNRREKN